MKRFPNHPLAALALLGSLVTGGAHAADAFTEAMQAANAPYRMALFKTNGQSLPEAQQALQQAQQAWSQLRVQFADKPVAPYDRDGEWGQALAAVTRVYAKAEAEMAASDLKRAHDTLEEVRDIMATLRQRNNVVVFSDHMNAYHEVMEHVLVDGPSTLEQPNGLLLLTLQAGALQYTAARLSTHAGPTLQKNPEFSALVQAVQQSVQALQAALLKQDTAAVKEAMGKLKGPYSKLFAKFG